MEGERDPRPLLVIFETLEFVQKTFDTKDVEVCMHFALALAIVMS